MQHLKYTEFYITNVCNISCINCNRFNNFAFSGHYYWNDSKDEYKKWSKIVSFDEIGVLGGEPTSNPDFNNWIIGLKDLWPKSNIRIITNGTNFKKLNEIYPILKNENRRVLIEINWHSLDRSQIEKDIENFLAHPIKKDIITSTASDQLWKNAYNNIKDDSWPDCKTPQDFVNLPVHIQKECKDMHHVSKEIWDNEIYLTRYTDTNNVTVELSIANSFNNCTIKYDPKTQIAKLHNSDKNKAMSVCYFTKCHHFLNGKLYKCGPTAVLPEFINQFPMVGTTHQKVLINSYEPAETTWSPDRLDNFFNNLRNATPIDQCSLCPESLEPAKFETRVKKFKIIQG